MSKIAGFLSARLSRRLLAMTVLSALAVSAVVIGGSQFLSRQASREAAVDKISGSLDARKAGLRQLERALNGDLAFLSTISVVQAAFPGLSEAYAELADFDEVDATRTAYVDENPHPADQRVLLDNAEDGSLYSSRHFTLNEAMRNFRNARGYSDLMLIGMDGVVLYSTAKRADFLTTLREGEPAETGLAKAFEKAAAATSPEVRAFTDFEAYAPNGGRPTAFVAAPVFAPDAISGEMKLLGVLAIEVTEAQIAEAIGAVGAFERGELVYLVGADARLRSDLPSTEADDMLASAPEGWLAPTSLAISDQIGLLGEGAVVGAQPASLFGAEWTLAAELPDARVSAAADNQLWFSLIAAIPALLGAAFLAWCQSRGVVGPLKAIDCAMERLAAGETSLQIPATERADEIGAMARKVEAFRRQIVQYAETQQQELENSRAMSAERDRMLGCLSDTVGAVVAAAGSGDFSKKVDASFHYEALTELGQGVNHIVEIVDGFLADLEQAVEGLSGGDLTRRMGSGYGGRFGDSAAALNQSMEKLGRMIAEIKGSGALMANAIVSLQGGAADLAARAQSQASSIEETAATMEQISGRIDETAKSAQSAHDIAQEAETRADRGQQVAGEAAGAMAQIEASTGRVSSIISTIDSIAFQTNLLAVNAAVEAARAGEKGQGFAIVAAEVRSLAQRSAEAAREINDLIADSAKHVNAGSGHVSNAGEGLREISETVTRLTETMGIISVASSEQSDGVREINGMLSNIDKGTQENAQLAERSAESAQLLSAEIEKLAALTEQFVLQTKDGAALRGAA